MFNTNDRDFKVKVPNGYLVAVESADKECYPGIFIFFSKDGKEFSFDDLITIVEHNDCTGTIRVDLYQKGQDDCSYTFDYENGELSD
jgi:hypothetical protein